MKEAISNYGWLVIILIILTLLLATSGTYADIFSKSNEKMAEEVGTNADTYMDDAFNAFKTKYPVTVMSSEYGSISINKSEYIKGETVEFTVASCKDDRVLTALNIKYYDGNTEVIENLSLSLNEKGSITCGDCGFIIEPIFSYVEGDGVDG